MKKACKDCPERQFYVRLFGAHFSGSNCWFDCEYADGDPKNDVDDDPKNGAEDKSDER